MANRRQMAWTTKHFDSNIASAASVILDVALDHERECTVARVLLDLWYDMQLTQAADTAQVIDVGIGVVTEDAFAALAVPDPNSDTDEPMEGWLYLARTNVRFEAASNTYRGGHLQADLRASRKLGRNTLMMHERNSVSEGAAVTIIRRGIVRVLCWLP